MSYKVTTFAPGESQTDDVVRTWLAGKGISQNDVSGYSIFRHQGEVPRIMLEMHFDDSPVSRETDSITVKVSPELLTEMGEWSAPVQVKIEQLTDGTYDMIARRIESPTGNSKEG